jgi:stage II sporulation protein AA (anti-sigma F factor antagonist)
MPSDFAVQTHITGRTALLTVSGELDLVSRPMLEHSIDQLLESDPELVIVDLRGLDFMDSTGLHVLVRAHNDAQEAGRRFALVRGREPVQRLFDLTGVSDSLTVVESPDQALEVPGAR